MSKFRMHCWLAGVMLGLVAAPGWAERSPLAPALRAANASEKGETKPALKVPLDKGGLGGSNPTAFGTSPYQGEVGRGVFRLRDRSADAHGRSLKKPATTVKEWIAQIEAATVQVTSVKLERTEEGLDIVLETAEGKPLQIDATKFRREGNNLIAEIPNAVLALTDAQVFNAEAPTTDVSRVQVVQTDASTIRVTVTGNNALPKQEVTLKTGEFAYSLKPEGEDADDEIVVTGDRRTYSVPNASTALGTDTPILETPFSVQVVPQDVLRDQQTIRLEEALNNVSGFVLGGNATAGRQASFTLRGFSGGTSVPTLRDGFRLYSFASFIPFPDLAGVEQVEVLKGPASILFGEIEPGGVINLVSKKPLTQPRYETEVQVGNREFLRFRTDLTGPLTTDGKLLGRLNALFQHEESFRNFVTDTNRVTIAPVLQWKLSDRTDFILRLDYLHQQGPADFGIVALGDRVAPVSREFVSNSPEDTLTTNYLNVGYDVEHRFSDNWKIRNGFRYATYDFDYSVLALPFFIDGNDIVRFFATQRANERSYSLSTSIVGKFATGSVNHILTAGVDLNRSESAVVTLFGEPTLLNIFNPVYNLVPKPNRTDLPLFGDFRRDANRLGIYLQDQIYLLNNLILVGGLRYDRITQRTTEVETAFLPASDVEQTDDALTPRIGLLYRPLPELALFANYSRSFKPNSAIAATGLPLPPEKGSGFEVGIKTELLNQKLIATLAYFDITKKNVGVTDPDNPLFSIATGEQRSRGFEVDIAGEILPGWKVIGSYAYLDAKISNDTDATLVGNRLAGVPFNKASLWTTYEILQGAFKGLGFGIGFESASDRFGDLANTFRVGSYLIGNASIFYRRNNYRFAVNLKNISNANYVRSVSGSEIGIDPGVPLTIIGSFSVEF